MKYLICFVFIFSAHISFAQKQFVVDPNAVVRTVSGDFSSIKVSSAINLYLSKGDDVAIAVSAPEEKYTDGIKTEIANGELNIYYTGEKFHPGYNGKINVYVAYKNLEQIRASAASNIYIAGVLESPQLNIMLNGASEMKGALKIGDLNIQLRGASDMDITGDAKNVNIESAGASDVKNYGFTAENCNIRAAGASDVNITVTGELSANASGASNVHFKGQAEIKSQEAHGASNIERVE